MRFPATPGLGLPAAALGVSVGGGFPCCLCLWRGVCAWCLCWCVWCVVVVSVLALVRLWLCLPPALVCVCVCMCGVLVACGCRSLLPPAVAGVGGGVAGVCCGWSLATPGGGTCVRLPATPGWVSLPVVVGVPRHSWLRAPGAVPRHSWLGSAGSGGVRLPATPGWGLPVAVGCFVKKVPTRTGPCCAPSACHPC